MKQLLQNLRNGQAVVADVPAPQVRPGNALVHSAVSLVSAGTERSVVEFAEKNLVAKASSRPDLVRQVLDKAKKEGILPTIEAAFNRLDQPMALGYSSAGTIIEVGEGLENFKVGDRVVCAGSGHAVHAEYAVVPQNLMVKINSEAVDFESAAFSTVGAVALHGFRLAQPQIGERIAVVGLGLLGLLAVQIAQAAGCEVMGIDLAAERVALCNRLGVSAFLRQDAENAAGAFTSGRGFDAVLICADTSSNDPVELAGQISRDRGRVIAVGAVGLNIPRKVYYEKELDFRVSRSYGPGRYDARYEESGVDYPIGFVRWTEGRNIESFVELLAKKRVDVQSLITHRFPIEDAAQAYELISAKSKDPYLGVILTYPQEDETQPARVVFMKPGAEKNKKSVDLSLGVLGAGNYASAVFLPTLQKVGGVRNAGIATASGLSAQHAASKFGFEYASSSDQQVLEDPNINVIAILTRHQHHAQQVQSALANHKHVFCEKPLALTEEELEDIFTALKSDNAPRLTVGFNRRFAPMAVRLKEFIDQSDEPFAAHYRVNAGFIPSTHWIHDPVQGGGRIIGEGCHFIDFLTFLAGSAPLSVSASALPDLGRYHQDNVVLTLTFPNGSLGTVSYLANGDKSVSKERVEVFCGGRIAELDDFRSLTLISNGQRKDHRSRLSQDKGHQAIWEAFLRSIRENQGPIIPYDQIWGVTRASFAAMKSIRENQVVKIS